MRNKLVRLMSMCVLTGFAALVANAQLSLSTVGSSRVSTATVRTSIFGDCTDPFTEAHTDDMKKTLKEAEEYTPGLRNYYVSELSDNRNEYLEAAISPSERKEWLTSHKIQPEDYRCFVPLLDQIKAAAQKTLSGYVPTGYNIHNPAEEKLMRGAITNLSDLTVLKSGLQAATWKIDKNEYGLPTARFKYGMVWAKSSKDDDGFCRIVYVNILQDYAGGGTYGSSYGNYIKSEPAGCPAGK